MTEGDDRRRVTIELEGRATEPSGWVSGVGGARRPFDGWLQLLAALDDAIRHEPDAAQRPRSGGTAS